MFSIGLFSTYLPYVLLAMFYGLYLGVHSIMKFELGSDEDNKLAAKTILKDHAETAPGAEDNTFYYDHFFGDDNSASDPLIHQFAGGTILLIPHEDPVHRSCYHPLFSRPPPAASL
jgi:hypothetical protein